MKVINLEIIKGDVTLKTIEDKTLIEFNKDILSRQTSVFDLKVNGQDFKRVWVEIGCGCTKAEFTKDNEEIRFYFTPNFLGETRKKVTIKVEDNEGNQSKEQFHIVANVI